MKVLHAATTALAMTLTLFLLTGTRDALAHDSNFCGHYTLSGKYWQLTYQGYQDYRDPGPRRTYHYHVANHNHRQQPSGPFYHYHQRYHFCGEAPYSSPTAVEAGPAPVHLPDGVDADAPVEPPVQVRPGNEMYTTYATLRSGAALQIVLLEPSLEPINPVGGRKVSRTSIGQCVVGDYTVSGKRTVEVASPAFARTLGHGC